MKKMSFSRFRRPTEISETSDATVQADNMRECLRKAAAWQWFMHGAGAQVKSFAEAATYQSGSKRASKIHQKPLSRFADEAMAAVDIKKAVVRDAITSVPLYDDVVGSRFGLHERRHEHENVAFEEHGTQAEKYKRPQKKHSEKLKPSMYKQKRQLHLLDFQRLFHKLLMPRPNNRSSTGASVASKASNILQDEEEDAQHRYHHYIFHHHDHYYHGPFDESDVLAQSRNRMELSRRGRRHSESSQFQQQLHYLYSELEEEGEDGEEVDEEEVQDRSKYSFSAFDARREYSERFLATPSMNLSDQTVAEHDIQRDKSVCFTTVGSGKRPSAKILSNGMRLGNRLMQEGAAPLPESHRRLRRHSGSFNHPHKHNVFQSYSQHHHMINSAPIHGHL